MKNVVLRNLIKFTGKHLWQSLRPATLLKKSSGTGLFLWILRSFYKQLFYRTPLVAAFDHNHFIPHVAVLFSTKSCTDFLRGERLSIKGGQEAKIVTRRCSVNRLLPKILQKLQVTSGFFLWILLTFFLTTNLWNIYWEPILQKIVVDATLKTSRMVHCSKIYVVTVSNTKCIFHVNFNFNFNISFK